MVEEEQKKDELLNHEGIYVGKQFRRKYKKKDGTGGKVYGIIIKQTMEEQFGKSFTIFSTTKGFDTYEEGDRVKLGYIVKPFVNKAGQESKSHIVMWIGKSTDQTPQTTLTEGSQSPQGIDLSHFNEFKDVYLNAIKTAGKEADAVHMVGSYIATYEADRTAELIKRCKEIVK